jgi:hypothetical protein
VAGVPQGSPISPLCFSLFIDDMTEVLRFWSSLPAHFLGDDFIPYVFKAKNLGVTFSYNLNWGDHVSTICCKVYGALAGLRRLADVIPFAVRMRLVVALAIVSISHSILIRQENLRWRSMLVSGMSIEEGFLNIFLMYPTRFWTVLC